MTEKKSWKERCIETADFAKRRGYALNVGRPVPKPPKEHNPRYNKTPLANRKSRLKAKYNITLEDFLVLCQEQNGCCAICKHPLGDSACVDHEHSTGLVRGILCRGCNVGLGFLKDDINVILEAANYLARHEASVLKVLERIKANSKE